MRRLHNFMNSEAMSLSKPRYWLWLATMSASVALTKISLWFALLAFVIWAPFGVTEIVSAFRNIK